MSLGWGGAELLGKPKEGGRKWDAVVRSYVATLKCG